MLQELLEVRFTISRIKIIVCNMNKENSKMAGVLQSLNIQRLNRINKEFLEYL